MINILRSIGKKKPGRYERKVPDDVQNYGINNSVVVSSSEFVDWVSSGFKTAGQFVSESTAMQVGAVYACVSLIGGAIASLPLHVYRVKGENRERVNNEIWWFLNEQPCVDYSSAVFWECMLASLLLQGDAFAVIERQVEGNKKVRTEKITGLEWVNPKNVLVIKDSDKKSLTYKVFDPVDKSKSRSFSSNDMIHVPGPGFNGLRGMSQINYVLRHAASIAMAADEYSARFFENGARPDFAIELPNTPTPEQQEMMRASWEDRYKGVERSHKPALLTGGAKVHELTMSAEDSQLLATRQFQVEDIARIFGVPSHMIGSSSSTSWGTGIEQMSIAFVKYTLARHLTKIEKELNRKLWPNSQLFYAQFNTSGLERGDYKTRNEGYRVGLGRAGEPGWLTVNEIRKLENLPPIPGGDDINTGITNASTPN
jgi:HK97 family phage portal protein